MENKKQQFKEAALKLGFDNIGITNVSGDLPYLKNANKALVEGRYGPLDYLVKTHNVRMDIQQFLPNCQSIIIVQKNYYTGNHPQTIEKEAKIARYAWGRDYHHWFKKRLKKLLLQMDEIFNVPHNSRIFNDTAPVLEKSWAQKAGLGFIGKSSLLISREFGTWTLLGGIATDIFILPDDPYIGPDCGSCNKCMESCPTKAIVEPRKVDANKCIATWTIERTLHPDSILNSYRDTEWAFGCDICQEVCPWNKFQKITKDEDFQAKKERFFLTKETFLSDLNGSSLNRTKKIGLLTNFLRIKNSLGKKTLSSIISQDN